MKNMVYSFEFIRQGPNLRISSTEWQAVCGREYRMTGKARCREIITPERSHGIWLDVFHLGIKDEYSVTSF